jgi:hypothetical protein
MAKTLQATWDFTNDHVDPWALTKGNASGAGRGNYISSESIVICAGPSTLAIAGENAWESMYPIGVCDTVQVMQNKGVIQLYEIGSRIPYIIPGRPITQFQISRVLFNGDSLLAALTNGMVEAGEADPTTYENNVMGGPGYDVDQTNVATGHFWLNLASHFFNNTFGIALFFKDSEKDWVGAFYAENCVLQQHSMAIQGQNMIVMENVGVRCTTFVPIEVPAVSV